MTSQITKAAREFRLADVQAVYSGPEGQLWELLMGEQIHIGGLQSSTGLADRAGIGPGQCGVDLCCASGAGMRFLVRCREVARMTGVDATHKMIEIGRRRCSEDGLEGRINFIEADVCDSGLPSGQFDFVWGEDAWCYVQDKARLIQESARLLRSGGTVAFTDWMEGSPSLSADDAERFYSFMKFPNILRLDDYASALKENDFVVQVAIDTGRFANHLRLYIDMLEQQLAYDALKIVGFDRGVAQGLLAEMEFTQRLARAGKIIQGLIVAQKRA